METQQTTDKLPMSKALMLPDRIWNQNVNGLETNPEKAYLRNIYYLYKSETAGGDAILPIAEFHWDLSFKIDVSKMLILQQIYEEFESIVVYQQFTGSNDSNNNRDDMPTAEFKSEDNTPIFKTNLEGFIIRDDARFIYINCYRDYIHIDAICESLNSDIEKVKDMVKYIYDKYMAPYLIPGAQLGVIKYEYDTFSVKYHNITDQTDLNMDLHYNDDFSDADTHIKDTLNTEGSGLIILHGKQGTGKTNYIRHLISQVDRPFIYVPDFLVGQFASPTFIAFLQHLKGVVLILEDCENILLSRDMTNEATPALSTILNMADGLLGDILNIKFICTFNTNTTRIDPALLRKGRLDYMYEFKPLSDDKAVKLGQMIGVDAEQIKELKDKTLANIYNISQNNNVQDKTKKPQIGFMSGK